MDKIKEQKFFVKGMHCASCEILIEKKLLGLDRVKAVEAKADKGEVLLELKGEGLNVGELNKIFKDEGYVFSDKSLSEKSGQGGQNNQGDKDFFVIAGFSLAIIAVFWFLNKLGIASAINVGSKSSLPAFFLFGVLAGLSSCAALVGGLVLSLSKQWANLYSDKNSTKDKFQPHLMFNAGRIIGFAVLGAGLGIIGSKLQFTLGFAPFLVIIVSIVMILLALQMLGVGALRKFQITMPKSATRYIANEKNFKGKAMPFVMGALTFFLPCGFTITAQGMALLSANPWQAALIMGFFALGTAPALLGIGLSAVKFSQKPHAAVRFAKIAGVLVLFFALFNINNQLTVLGYGGFADLWEYVSAQTNNNSAKPNNQQTVQNQDDLPPVLNGKQIMKMEASVRGYKPRYFTVRVGVPVRWEITDTGTSGCTNAIIARDLFSGQIPLTPGQTVVKEFTIEKPGKYKFSCWMGMVTGTIEAVDGNNPLSDNSSIVLSKTSEESPACGCGCGGGVR